MITDLVQIQRLGEKKVAENEKFRRHMKVHDFPERRFRSVALDFEEKIDCQACGNCCKVAETDVTRRDVDRLAKYLGLTPRQFVAQYTTQSAQDDEDIILRRTEHGCIFLDGNDCTVGDSCAVGLCLPGAATSCDDANLCTLDSCDVASGVCGHVAISGCGNACNVDADCNDANSCTTEKCVSNACTFTVLSGTSCQTSDLCTKLDTCQAGVCTTGQPVTCNDNNACTTDSCDAKTGKCVNTPVADGSQCNDGSNCTTQDACASGKCAGTAVVCNDGNACTNDFCATQNLGGGPGGGGPGGGIQAGNCVYQPVQGCTVNCIVGGPACNDNNPCTNDSCDPAKGCVYTNNTALCSDGSVCSLDDTCTAGKCVGKSQMVCNDFNPCTTDTCDPKLGCQYKAVADKTTCDDGNGCTTGDVCTAGKCAGKPDFDCDDGNPCTTDGCDKATGNCLFGAAPVGSSCDDGNACTQKEVCASGQCKNGVAVDCNDNNPCTDDSCDPVKGCSNKVNNADCDADGNACTVGDACAAGKCAAGKLTVCNDNNACTTDTCTQNTGACTYAKINNCGQACLANSDCNDNNQCTLDTCNTFTGNCINTTLNGCAVPQCQVATQATDCNDNNVCTFDVCNTFANTCVYQNLQNCVATPACTVNTDCNDGNACTIDVCNPSNQSCVYSPIPGCNPNAVCSSDADCNDNNVCTQDTCNTFNKSCVHVTLPGCQ